MSKKKDPQTKADSLKFDPQRPIPPYMAARQAKGKQKASDRPAKEEATETDPE